MRGKQVKYLRKWWNSDVPNIEGKIWHPSDTLDSYNFTFRKFKRWYFYKGKDFS